MSSYFKGWRLKDTSQMVPTLTWTQMIFFVVFVTCCLLWANMLFATLIESYHNANDIAFIVVVTSCYPIVTGLLSSWYFNEPITNSMWMGMVWWVLVLRWLQEARAWRNKIAECPTSQMSMVLVWGFNWMWIKKNRKVKIKNTYLYLTRVIPEMAQKLTYRRYMVMKILFST